MFRKIRQAMLNLTLISILVISVFTFPLLMVNQASAEGPTTVLTPKWALSNMGTNWESGLVLGDVTGDGQEDVVFCGGSNNTLWVLNGATGAITASYYNSRIGTYCQPQLYDVDGDGVLDILCVLYYEPGLAALKYNGSSTLHELWEIYSQADQAPGGSVGSGSVMAKPVAGDIDGDGHLDIFLASQDVSPLGGYDGTIVRIDYQGNILATTFTWRACSGGLSLGDTDNDGVFELYQGDRDMDYNDGGYGKGVKSYWAENLTERWIRLDDITSSQAPVLADVNGDGIKDVITGMYNNMWVLNSTNGEVIKFWKDNKYDSTPNVSLSVHYGITVYDIDGDGNLEILCNDGDHDDQPYTDVFDLGTGQMDAQLYHFGGLNCTDPDYEVGEFNHTLGTAKWSPLVADIDPTNEGMEIISTPEGTGLDSGNWWNGAILIWSSNYESIQNVTRTPSSTPGVYSSTRLSSQIGFPVVQDIDSDGLLELVVSTSNGRVYAFDTIAPAPGYNEEDLPGSERIRSEVTYYGEDRLAYAHNTTMPGAENYWTAPVVAAISPGDNKLAIPVTTNQLSFKLRDEQNETLNYTVTTSPNIGSTNGSIGAGNSSVWTVRPVSVSGLAYDTTYRWTITANDSTHITTQTYTFRTELETPIGNDAPTQDSPSMASMSNVSQVLSTFQTSAQGTTDADGNDVTNIYRWKVNGNSVTQVLLPFDTRNEISTKDYSGYGNDGDVIGASWVPNGVVGGAYQFDGKDDAIIISDGGAGYFNDVDYPDNQEELGGFGNWNAVTVEAWVYLDEYTNGSTIVGKIPSYALGFQGQSFTANRLYGAVWPYSGVISQDPNNATVDRMRTVTAVVSLNLHTWYHIAFTYENSGKMYLYLNGELVGTSSSVYSGPLSPSRGEPVYIGRLVQPFAGMIDDVRISSYALPKEQIQNHYNDFVVGDSNSSKFTPYKIASSGDSLSCDVIPSDSYIEGTTDNTSSLEIASTARLVVRGDDDRIYLKTYDGTQQVWDVWTQLQGATETPPTAVTLGDELHIVVRGVNNGQIWHSYINLFTGIWSNWTLLDGATPSAPTLTANSTHLCLVVRGNNDVIYYKFYQKATRTWGSWIAVPNGATVDTPAATLVDNCLHISVRGVNGNQIWHSYLNLTSGIRSDWELLDGATNSTPTFTNNGTHLCLVVRGYNEKIYYRFYDIEEDTWTAWKAFPFGATSDAPAATVIDNTLQIVVRGVNYNQIWHGELDLSNDVWSGWTRLDGATPSKPILTS